MNRTSTVLLLVPMVAGTALSGGCARVPGELRLDQASQGKTYTVREQGPIALSLPSNATTGYQWKLVKSGGPTLENTGHRYEAPPGGRIGAGGVETWEFRAARCGSAKVRLEYRRPWESMSIDPADTFEAVVTVVRSGKPAARGTDGAKRGEAR
jgi:inhibitor of cysteine peptidase